VCWVLWGMVGSVRTVSFTLNRSRRTEFQAFLLVGGAATLIEFMVFNILAFGFSTPILVSNALALLSAGALSFVGNYLVTFKESRVVLSAQLVLKFAAVTGLTILAHQVSLALFLRATLDPSWLELNVAKAAIIIVLLVARFIALRTLVFRRQK
jgi:putative flippase GtrA